MDDQNSRLLGEMRPRGAAIALAILIAVPELLFAVADMPFGLFDGGAADLRRLAVVSFGFWPGHIHGQLEGGSFGLNGLTVFVSYPLMHLSAVNAIFSILFILVVLRLLSGIVRQSHCMIVFFGSAALGALAYYFLAGSDFPLVGASPGFLGLFGVAAAVAVMAGGSEGNPSIGRVGRTMLILPALLIGFEIVASLLFGGRGRWVADLAGFAAGFLAAPFLFDVPHSRLFAKILQLLK